jgi:translation initiation factor IF-2
MSVSTTPTLSPRRSAPKNGGRFLAGGRAGPSGHSSLRSSTPRAQPFRPPATVAVTDRRGGNRPPRYQGITEPQAPAERTAPGRGRRPEAPAQARREEPVTARDVRPWSRRRCLSHEQAECCVGEFGGAFRASAGTRAPSPHVSRRAPAPEGDARGPSGPSRAGRRPSCANSGPRSTPRPRPGARRRASRPAPRRLAAHPSSATTRSTAASSSPPVATTSGATGVS